MHRAGRFHLLGDLIRFVELRIPYAPSRQPGRIETNLEHVLPNRQSEFPLVVRGRWIRRGIHQFVLGDHRLAFAQRPVEQQFGDQEPVGGTQYGPAQVTMPQRTNLG